MRIIQLFEGDFNGALKFLIGRKMMQQVVATNQLDANMFGSIPGRTAQKALITLHSLVDNH
jgi:hypothetical protein